MADAAALSLAVGLGVTNTFTVWTTLNPSLSDVREGNGGDAQLTSVLHAGERDAALLALGVAIAASLIIKSPWPVCTSLALIAALFILYENARKA